MKKNKNKKLSDLFVNLLSWIWIGTWFGAIWVGEIRKELFFTGLFSFILGIISVSVEQKE